MMKLPISLVIITLNEEHNIERCIRSVPFVSEILIVDSESQDRTREIADGLSARVLQRPWTGFGPQKKFATAQAQNDWILSLDADEALSAELADEIVQQFSQLDPRTGYEMPRKSFYLGRWIEHGGWYPDSQLRLYNRKFSDWPDSSIHERVRSPSVKRFKSDIHHYVFQNLAHQVETNNRYSSLLAEQDVDLGKKYSVFKLLLKPWTKFLECYFLKLGFRDGLPGLIIAVSAAYSNFLRWAKIWEHTQKNQNGSRNVNRNVKSR